MAVPLVERVYVMADLRVCTMADLTVYMTAVKSASM